MKQHPVRTLVIDGAECDVDVGIIPVVEWLNDLPGVKTLYSCQGDDDARPYVMLTADDLAGSGVLGVLWLEWEWDEFGRPVVGTNLVEVTVNYLYRSPRYVLRWANTRHLARFKELLRGVVGNFSADGQERRSAHPDAVPQGVG